MHLPNDLLLTSTIAIIEQYGVGEMFRKQDLHAIPSLIFGRSLFLSRRTGFEIMFLKSRT